MSEPNIDGGEKARVEKVARAIADARYTDGAPRNDEGHFQSRQFEFRDQARAAIAAYRNHPAPSTGNEGGADEIERINRESMQKREADLLRRGGADYEAKAREIANRIASEAYNSPSLSVQIIAAALAQSAADMRARCEAIARDEGRWHDFESEKRKVSNRIADAIAVLNRKRGGEIKPVDEMTDIELSLEDQALALREAEAEEWEGSGSPMESFYERWSAVTDEINHRKPPHEKGSGG